MLNVLYLYNATQTYTNAVYEHLSALGEYSENRSFFLHQDPGIEFNIDLSHFDAVAIHFSIRLPYDQISSSTAAALSKYQGLKFLFIQDEYDFTQKAWQWIKRLGVQLVFTVVPGEGIERVYPKAEFPGTRFVSNLTGYVPYGLAENLDQSISLPSQRSLLVGYRGRPLPIRYGKLGIEKISIGKLVKQYCDEHQIECDIAWAEESRIYGPRWYKFMASCRSMLGSESGSNVFDWDGTLVTRIAQFRAENPEASDDDVYSRFVQENEIDGLMNQVSPRVFEAIAARTVLVLYEGNYSGVIVPDEHFISLKKDGSNLADVMSRLRDGAYVDAMAERAFNDVIRSGRYAYEAFAKFVDGNVNEALVQLSSCATSMLADRHSIAERGNLLTVTTSPVRAPPPQLPTHTFVMTVVESRGLRDFAKRFPRYLWGRLPEPFRSTLRPMMHRLKEIGRQNCRHFFRQLPIAAWGRLPNATKSYLKPRLKRFLGRG